MTSRFPSLDAPARATGPAKMRNAMVFGVLAAIGAVAWSGCGPGSETRYYCDAAGCFSCDAYGCSEVAPPAKPTCTGNTSCPPGSICTEAGCTVVCSDDVPCPKGEVCKSGLCTPPAAEPPGKKECTTKADCTDGKTCVGGACEACGGTAGPCPCTGPADCTDGMACIGGACTAPQNTCKFSSECGDPTKVCADGQCLTSCEATPCADGFTCDKGVCKPSPTGGTTCQNGQQCSGETPRCVGGSCVKACTGAAPDECGEGKFCDQGACVLDTRPKPNCTDDVQCGGTAATPKKCLGGVCKFTCTSDQYCRTIDNRIGYCAKDGVCRTAAEANAQCTGPADCPGQSCVDNQCK